MVSSVAALAASPIANMVFTRPEYGILGAATALTVTNVVGSVTCVLLAVFHSKSKLGRLPAPDFDGQTYASRVFNIDGAIEFVRVGMPAMVLVCAEWWSLEVLLVFVSSMGTVEAAAFASLVNIVVVMWALPTGTAIATSVRLGNALGANLPHVAEAWRRVALIANGVIATLDASILVLFMGSLPHLYTSDPAVVKVFQQVAPSVAFMHATDAMLTAVQNTYRGAGKQARGAKFCIMSLWAVGVPACFLAASLAPHSERPTAAVLGYSTGFVVMVVTSIIEMRRWDWPAMAAETSAHPAGAVCDSAESESV
jgi:Na+-driven multidrug efflux pump